jgi:hypothetical protein
VPFAAAVCLQLQQLCICSSCASLEHLRAVHVQHADVCARSSGTRTVYQQMQTRHKTNKSSAAKQLPLKQHANWTLQCQQARLVPAHIAVAGQAGQMSNRTSN